MLRLNTKLDSAKVYRSGAEMVRKGTVELPEGKNTLYVYGLTQTAVLDTVRLFSGEGVTCANQRFERVSEIENELESDQISEKIEQLKKQVEVKQLQINLWQTNGDFTNSVSQSASDIQEYIELLPERIEKLSLEILEKNKEIEKLEKDRSEATKKENASVMAVDIHSDRTGSVPFELRYFENSAWWSPVYELHTDAKSDLDLRLRAKILQQSGEDWKDIALALYTGNPVTGGTLPELSPIYLNIQEPIKARSVSNTNSMMFGSMMMSKASSLEMEDTMVVYDEAPMTRVATEEASVSEEDTMTEYSLGERKSVVSGSAGTMADLQKYVIPASYTVSSAPSQDPNAYLIATVKTADLPLTSAISSAVYLNDSYVGDAYIDPDLTKDDASITIGKSEQVHVSRTKVSQKASTTLFKGQKVMEYVYETRLTNSSKSDLDVTLKDQIPVSQDKEITVEAKELSGASLDAETGILTYKIPLPAGQTKTVTLSYKVNWPKDKNLKESTSKAKIKWCPNCGASTQGAGRFCLECGTPLT